MERLVISRRVKKHHKSVRPQPCQKKRTEKPAKAPMRFAPGAIPPGFEAFHPGDLLLHGNLIILNSGEFTAFDRRVHSEQDIFAIEEE